MQATEISRVGVLGCGQMGAGIAEVCAQAGCDVVVCEDTVELAERGSERIRRSLDRAVRAERLSAADADGAFARVNVTADASALVDRQLVVEAIVESEAAKLDAFRRLDELLEAPDAVIASNTSSIPIMKLAAATRRPEQVIGIHFFNPVPVLRLVEVITTLTSSEDTIALAESFATERLHKRVIRSPDRAGFVVNALLIPYLLAAIRMFEAGTATAEDIDTGMVEGCAHPMGPLALADLIGLDTTNAVAQSLYEEFKEPLYAPPPLLNRMVDAGLLGRKTGRGFYSY